MTIEEFRLHAAMDAFYPGEDWRKDLGCALDNSLRDMTAAIEAANAASTGLETPRMLVLSTAHISDHTNSSLYLQTDDVPQAFEKRSQGDSVLIGWLISLVGDEPFPHTCPADLLAIRELALSSGCTWIMLDRDADVVTGLPTYEW